MDILGQHFTLEIFGASHAPCVGVTLRGVPASLPLAPDDFTADILRRKSGAKGTTPRGFSSGFSSKKSVLVEIYDPNNNLVDRFQRGEKEDAWGNQSLTKVTGSWSRCPNGTGKFMITDVTTLGAKNPDTGTEDPTVVQ